jgi:hypothetical protein
VTNHFNFSLLNEIYNNVDKQNIFERDNKEEKGIEKCFENKLNVECLQVDLGIC